MDTATLEGFGLQITGNKYAAVAAFTLVLYDYLLTVSDEFEYIWRRKITPVNLIFVINRYYALCALCVSLVAIISPLFVPTICERYSLFLPYAIGIPLTFFPDLIVGLRVLALYHGHQFIFIFLGVYLVAELSVAVWIYTFPGAHPLMLLPQFSGVDAFQICTELTADKLGNVRSAAFQLMQTVYDTIVFILIISKTAADFRSSERGTNIRALMAAHGVVYYAVIFTGNLLWALMVIFAPAGMKYVTVFPALVLDCIIVNRITIELRSFGRVDPDESLMRSTWLWFADDIPQRASAQPMAQLRNLRPGVSGASSRISRAGHYQKREDRSNGISAASSNPSPIGTMTSASDWSVGTQA